MNQRLWYIAGGCFIVLILIGIWRFHAREDECSPAKRIIVGISADFPPFTYMDEGKLVGLDIDLMQEIGKRLGKEIVFTNMPFGTLLPALQLGTIHVIASGITATPERAQHVLFTTPYLDRDALLIVSLKKSPIRSVDELSGKDVVVNEGYTADLYISSVEGPNIIRLKSPADAFLSLSNGRVAAFITAYNAIKPFFDQYEGNEYHGEFIPGTDENASLAVTPHYPELQAELEEALQTMRADGTLQTLLNRWGIRQ